METWRQEFKLIEIKMKKDPSKNRVVSCCGRSSVTRADPSCPTSVIENYVNMSDKMTKTQQQILIPTKTCSRTLSTITFPLAWITKVITHSQKSPSCQPSERKKWSGHNNNTSLQCNRSAGQNLQSLLSDQRWKSSTLKQNTSLDKWVVSPSNIPIHCLSVLFLSVRWGRVTLSRLACFWFC